MATMDTHEAVKLLQSAGLDEVKAEAIVRVVGAGQDALATKAELRAQATSVAQESFARTTAANLEIFELRLRDHLTLRLGAMLLAAACVQVLIFIFLLTQFLSN